MELSATAVSVKKWATTELEPISISSKSSSHASHFIASQDFIPTFLFDSDSIFHGVASSAAALAWSEMEASCLFQFQLRANPIA